MLLSLLGLLMPPCNDIINCINLFRNALCPLVLYGTESCPHTIRHEQVLRVSQTWHCPLPSPLHVMCFELRRKQRGEEDHGCGVNKWKGAGNPPHMRPRLSGQWGISMSTGCEHRPPYEWCVHWSKEDVCVANIIPKQYFSPKQKWSSACKTLNPAAAGQLLTWDEGN